MQDIKLDASAEVCVEVVAGGDGGVAAGDTATGSASGFALVEAGTHDTDAGDQLPVDAVGDLGRVNAVEVVKDRTISRILLSRVGTATLGPSPEDFGPDAQIVPEQHIAVKAGIGATAKPLGNLTVAAARAGRWS